MTSSGDRPNPDHSLCRTQGVTTEHVLPISDICSADRLRDQGAVGREPGARKSTRQNSRAFNLTDQLHEVWQCLASTVPSLFRSPAIQDLFAATGVALPS